MAFDAGAIVARAEVDQAQFNRDLDAMEQRVRDFERTPHEVEMRVKLNQSDLNRARSEFASFDQRLFQDAVQRQRAGRGMMAGLFGRVTPGSAGGASLFGGLVGSGGSAAAAQTEQAVRSEMARVDQQISRDTTQRSGLLSRLFGSFGAAAGGAAGGGFRIPGLAGGAGNKGFGSGLFSGIGPGVLGLGFRSATIAGLGSSVLGALPALTSPLAALGVGGLGVGVAGLLGKQALGGITPLLSAQSQAQQALSMATTPTQIAQAKAQLAGVQQALAQQPAALQKIFGSLSQLQARWHSFTASLAPALVGPIQTISKTVISLLPAIRSVFGSAMTLVTPFIKGIGDIARMILPGLGQAFRAAAPLMRPLLDGIGGLVKGILPGLVTLLRASSPAVKVFAQILGTLGSDLGKMFAIFAPVLRQSSVILKALFDVIGAIFPVIGKLAAIFAKTLAPVFVVFATAIRSLLPFLTLLGKVLGALAAAVLGDLASAFKALAKLLVDMSPALAIIAKTFEHLFNVLENSGVFAIIGDALEKLAPVLAKLVNTLVSQLAPILPILITLLSQFATIMIDLLAAGLTTVLSGITGLLKAFPFLVPLLGVITAAWLAWNLVMAANPIGLIIIAIGALIGGITLLVTHWRQVWGFIKSIAMDAWNFINHGWGEFLFLPITALIKAIQFLSNNWQRIWGDIKKIAADAWNFIVNGWGKFLLPMLGPVGILALGALELYKHWSTIWGDIKTISQDLWHYLWTDFGQKIFNFFTNTIPGWFKTGARDIGNAWNDIENAVKGPVNWVIQFVLNDGIIKAFNWISGKVGGPHIPNIPTIGQGQTGAGEGSGGGFAHGGRISAGTGPTADDVLIRASKGETVVSAAHTSLLAPLFAALGIRGFSGGGLIGDIIGAISGALGLGNGAAIRELLGITAAGGAVGMERVFAHFIPKGEGGAIGDLYTLLHDNNTKLELESVRFLLQKIGGLQAQGAGGAKGGGVAPNGPVQAFARRLLAAYGWSNQWTQFNDVVMRESGWNPTAANPSGAYGIPQALPGSKMAQFGSDWRTDPYTQLRWMMWYIKTTYGNPAGAWNSELTRGWYDGGGWMEPGLQLAGNRTGMREAVLTPSQSDAFVALGRAFEAMAYQNGGHPATAAQMERLIAAVLGSAGKTGAVLGDVLNGVARSARQRGGYL